MPASVLGSDVSLGYSCTYDAMRKDREGEKTYLLTGGAS